MKFRALPSLLFPAFTLLVSGSGLIAADLHVAATGNDRNPGTATAPLLSLAAARDAARAFAGKEPVVVHVAAGVYYLPDSLVFGPADSGSGEFPVIYQAEREGETVLSGGLKLDLKWERHRDGVFVAATPAGLAIDQVFINGRRQRMARYPDYDAAKTTAAYQGFSADAFAKERAVGWSDPSGGYIHAMHTSRWGGYHYRITGKNPDGSVAYEGGWQNNRQMGMHKDFRMVENIFEELNAPGEWFHNAKTNTLYFQPEPGTDLTKATVEVVRLRHLVEFQGSSSRPVKHIALKGFVFRHAARTFMDTREPLLRSDWTIYRGGAVLATGTEDIRILDSEFDQVGGNALFFSNYNRRAQVKGCHIHDAGASGVCFVGDPAAVRNPLFEYARTQDLTKIDRTPGPKSDNYPADSVVEDCLIHGIGRVERQPAGVQISMASGITVRDTSIYDCARAGINIGDGTWGGHRIERCDVFDTVLETHDHGSFNSWGRDRYWTSNHRGVSQPEVKKDPKLPYFDAVAPTVIRDSRWRCDHGWDIDLDDGSSNYEIHHNLMLSGGLKFREGFGRKAYNNILINNGFHPHVWFDDSASSFRSNIVMKPHADVGQPAGWAREVDGNFFTTAAALAEARKNGGDTDSLAGDPMFIDPANGDFRVTPGSPALKIGFKNFPMDQFGVKKPALKAIAKHPVIPALEASRDPARVDKPDCYWLGARLHALEGEEFSAFGVAKEDGGVQLADVPAMSPAAMAGLRTNDLIQGINGRSITGTGELLAAHLAAGEARMTARVVRDQKPIDLALADTPILASESAMLPGEFVKIKPVPTRDARASTSVPTGNDPVAVLIDGKLATTYGPVFANGVNDGKYKLDLGAGHAITAANTWSYNQDGKRARQCFTLFGSNAPVDPGWNTRDASRFTPLGSIDIRPANAADAFLATSLRARPGQSLGTFRWLVWAVAPVTDLGENTAIQELGVETAR